jgi:hypothetical protein
MALAKETWPAVKAANPAASLGLMRHRLRDAQVAHPELSQHCFHIPAEPVDQLLRQCPPVRALFLDTVKHSEQMQREKRTAARKGVGGTPELR